MTILEIGISFPTKGATSVLQEVQCGGCVDTGCLSLVLLFMCLGPKDVACRRMGKLLQVYH
jgi:hypothetical protein